MVDQPMGISDKSTEKSMGLASKQRCLEPGCWLYFTEHLSTHQTLSLQLTDVGIYLNLSQCNKANHSFVPAFFYRMNLRFHKETKKIPCENKWKTPNCDTKQESLLALIQTHAFCFLHRHDTELDP